MSKRILKMLIFIIVLIIVKSDLVYAYKSYKYGDVVKYGFDEYYVIEDSDEEQDYIYLLKKEPLTKSQLLNYGKDENGNIFINKYNELHPGEIFGNQMPFYTSETCKFKCDIRNGYYCEEVGTITSGCKTDYESSDVKKVLDKWKKENFEESELKVVNGYDVRLLSYDDLINRLYFEYQYMYSSNGNDFYGVSATEKSLLINSYSWLMDSEDDGDKVKTISYSNVSSSSVLDESSVLPTVYLKKCALESSCGSSSYTKYRYGQKIKFRGEEYYVIDNSGSNQDYVTLLKGNPLSINDIQKYGLQDTGNGNKVSYYVSQKCNENDHTDCKLEYDESDVKVLVDNWANDNFYDGELQKIEGYKARLINEDELLNKLYYGSGASHSSSNIYRSTDDTLSPLKINDTWTMIPDVDFENTILSAGYSVAANAVYYSNQVIPVINLNKCALNGTCVLNKSNKFEAGDEVTYNENIMF